MKYALTLVSKRRLHYSAYTIYYNEMNSNAILPAAGAGVLGILMAVYLLAGKKPLLKKLGPCLLPLSRKPSYLFIAVVACVPVLFALLCFRDLGWVMSIVLILCGLLCVYMGVQDIIYRSISGVYEKGICADGKLLWNSGIEEVIPLPDTDSEGSCILQFTVKSGIVSMRLDSPAEREKAASILKKTL